MTRGSPHLIPLLTKEFLDESMSGTWSRYVLQMSTTGGAYTRNSSYSIQQWEKAPANAGPANVIILHSDAKDRAADNAIRASQQVNQPAQGHGSGHSSGQNGGR